MTESTTHMVKSAQRVLEVIEFFNEERQAATVTEISCALSYPQSSTSVLLKCLRQLGYLYYNRHQRTYRLTARAALLGCWAEDGKYRGGPAIEFVDAISEATAETVALSTGSVDYAMHYLHVTRGSSPQAIEVSAGTTAPLLHNIEGELHLASYPDTEIRLALHRINAEEADPARRVNIDEKLAEMRAMREQGWGIGAHGRTPSVSAIAMLLPRHKGGGRVVISLVARDDVVESHGSAFLDLILTERDRYFSPAMGGNEQGGGMRACSIVRSMNAADGDDRKAARHTLS